jgi:hypothetical protein
MRNACEFLVGNLEGKRPLRTLIHRCGDNIKMELTDAVCDDVHWIHLAEDRNSDYEHNEFSGSIKGG